MDCIIICGVTGSGGYLAVTGCTHGGSERDEPQLLADTGGTAPPSSPRAGIQVGREKGAMDWWKRSLERKVG